MMKMKRMFPIVLAVVIALGALMPVVLQAGTASACEQGLTPGYWKNHTEMWGSNWRVWRPVLGYVYVRPATSFHDVFGVGPNTPLIDVLRTGGGGEKALGRHAVAALLNSYRFSPDWYSAYWVIDRVQYAYSSGNFESVKNQLEALNQLGVNGD
ncbi:MAG: hypothetical protein A2Y72_00250 [Chloroflexi bacterium RBG_13_53_26]|jgi:hypothetical protein|nr:MAG: hypothetical protein A2Y72_00250 [Chloroflexi bacterium RBG_13_53_26]